MISSLEKFTKRTYSHTCVWLYSRALVVALPELKEVVTYTPPELLICPTCLNNFNSMFVVETLTDLTQSFEICEVSAKILHNDPIPFCNETLENRIFIVHLGLLSEVLPL